MEKQIDVLAYLSQIVQENTRHFQSDFDYDRERLRSAAKGGEEERSLCWMSRPCGTWCFSERDVFLRDSQAHIVWTYRDYEAEADQIKACRIVLNPAEDGDILTGDIYPLNFKEHIQRVKQTALPIHHVTLEFKDEQRIELPYEEYKLRVNSLISKHGAIETLTYSPVSEAELSCVLRMEHRTETARTRRPAAKKHPSAR